MKVQVIYVINGDTQIEVLEAPRILYCLKKKTGKITLKEENGITIGVELYGHCERISFLELSSSGQRKGSDSSKTE